MWWHEFLNEHFLPYVKIIFPINYLHCFIISNLYSINRLLKGGKISSSGIQPFQPCRPKQLFENSIDPDEMVHNEPFHQDLHCLPFCYWFLTESPFCISEYVQIQGWESPLKKTQGLKGKINCNFLKYFQIDTSYLTCLKIKIWTNLFDHLWLSGKWCSITKWYFFI